ncbi:MAG TPA: hypothetical protein VNC50_17850, partial [Planctomycetia bacterium]|nr:hypothetical protein [Planctomycetia bacterium]
MQFVRLFAVAADRLPFEGRGDARERGVAAAAPEGVERAIAGGALGVVGGADDAAKGGLRGALGARLRFAVIVVARDGDRVVGAATAAPLATQDAAWQAPLAAAGFDIGRCFYFGESVL